MKLNQIPVGESFVNAIDIGSGPVVLLVHGFPLSHRMWKYQIEALSDRFRFIAPDLPGFGSSPAGEAMSLSGLADGLALMLDNMGVTGQVAYCGLSMGGYVGWQFWKHHRQRLSHLIACDTRAACDTDEMRRARDIAARSVRQSGAETVANSMVQKLFHQPDSESKQSIVEEVHQVICQTSPASIAAGQLAMAERPDATTWISEIEIPTLFVVGQFDGITTPREMRANADLVPGSVFLEIADAGHMAPLENHVEFNQGLVEFLER